MEHVNLVNDTFVKIEVCVPPVAGEWVHGVRESNGPVRRAMSSAEVDGKLPVDEDPDVIVAGEPDFFASSVLEAELCMGREVEVAVVVCVITKPEPIDWEEGRRIEDVAVPIRSDWPKLERQIEVHVQARNIPVPLPELIRPGQGERDAAAGESWPVIRIEKLPDQSGLGSLPEIRLKVRMPSFFGCRPEIEDSQRQRNSIGSPRNFATLPASLDPTERTATVTRREIAVIATLSPHPPAVAADRVTSAHIATETRFDSAVWTAAVSAHIGAVVTGLSTHDE